MLIKTIIISMTLSASFISVASHANTLNKSTEVIPPPNKPARITTSSLPAATEGSNYNFKISAKDPEAQTLRFRLISGPKALKISKKGILSFKPDFNSAGVHKVIISVSDGEISNQKTLTLSVHNTNRAPFFKSHATKNATENFRYNYPIVIHDNDTDDQLKLSLIEGPKGLILSESELQWLPGFEDKGSYPVTIRVSDQNGESSIQSFQLHVHNSNQAPIWKTQQLAPAKEAQNYEQKLLAEDPDGREVSYTLIKGPKGLKLNTSGQFNFIPDYTQAGKYKVAALAHDDISSTKIEFILSIENSNRAPVFNSTPPLKASENVAYRYTLQWQDEDQDEVIIQLLESPKGMTLEGTTLSWLPDFETMGQHQVKISMNDKKDTSEQIFFIDVASTNRLPSFKAVEFNETQLQENKPWSLELDTSDDDGHEVVLSLESKIEGLSLSANTLSWTPNYEQAGVYQVIVNANDGIEKTPTVLHLQVTNKNRAPAIDSQPVISAKEGQPYNYELTVTDADKTRLNISLVTAPLGMKIVNNKLVWQPSYEQAGLHHIEWLVNDGELSAKQGFDINVANSNRKPVFHSQPIIETVENADYQYNVSVYDPDGATVELSLISGPDGMELIKLKNAQTDSYKPAAQYALRYKPDFNAVNNYKVLLQAQDPESTTQQAFDLAVHNTNRLPVFNSKPNEIAYENIAFHYTVNATDADKEKLSYSLTLAPKGMQLKKKQLNWLPEYHHSGEHTVAIQVSDGIDQVEQRFIVTVNETNREPFITEIKNQNIIAKNKFSYKLQANDIDGNKLNFRLVNGPEKMRINRSGKLSWRTTLADIGSHTVVVEASDSDLKFRRYFKLNVKQPQDD